MQKTAVMQSTMAQPQALQQHRPCASLGNQSCRLLSHRPLRRTHIVHAGMADGLHLTCRPGSGVGLEAAQRVHVVTDSAAVRLLAYQSTCGEHAERKFNEGAAQVKRLLNRDRSSVPDLDKPAAFGTDDDVNEDLTQSSPESSGRLSGKFPALLAFRLCAIHALLCTGCSQQKT